jgi:SAM-dependent methyltransferase
MPDLNDPLPEPEMRFQRLLGEYYAGLGFDPTAALTHHWIEATGPATYRAGKLATQEIGALLKPLGRRVLDVGCGFAGTLLHLSADGAHGVGLEYDRGSLALAKKRMDLHGVRGLAFLSGDGFRMPFEDGSFDLVIATDVLEHVPNRNQMLSEMARVLRSGGLMYLAFPNLLSLRNAYRDPHHHLPGATLMPKLWAEAYCRRVRGHSYDCEVLPVARLVARHCRTVGVHLWSVRTSERVLHQKIAEPASIHGRARSAFILAQRIGLSPLLRGLVRLRATLGAQAVLAGFKD